MLDLFSRNFMMFAFETVRKCGCHMAGVESFFLQELGSVPPVPAFVVPAFVLRRDWSADIRGGPSSRKERGKDGATTFRS
jgi:hypothetical protein